MESLSPRTNSAAARGLPSELLLLIVDRVLPANPRALISASHSSTKTLLALTRVSRTTYAQASKLLRQRCMYIDSSRRLGDVLLCMPRLVPTMPPVFSLRHITSLYLAPFRLTQDVQPTAIWVRELFCEVCETLRRLVVQMPFDIMNMRADYGAKRTLRDGFEQLTKLEEFTCLGQYPALTVPDGHTDIWRLWPDLKRLVLFGVPVDNHWLWWDIATLPQLEHVVLVRSQHLEGTNIKDQYFHKLPRDDPRLGRRIRVVLLDAAWESRELVTTRWEQIDPKERMTVELYRLPTPRTGFYEDVMGRELVTSWVKRGALTGSIWDWRGDKVG